MNLQGASYYQVRWMSKCLSQSESVSCSCADIRVCLSVAVRRAEEEKIFPNNADGKYFLKIYSAFSSQVHPWMSRFIFDK